MISHRFKIFKEFIGTFVKYAFYLREVIITLNLLIVVAGCVISIVEEDVTLSNGIYFAFITALSIGYGDITPHSVLGKIVSVGIGFIGILFVGINAAVATRALADTVKRHLPTHK